MKKRRNYFFLFFLILVLFISSCAKNVAFTRSIIKDYNLSHEDIEYLQFYLSDSLILEREIEDINKELTDSHSLKKKEDKHIDQIVFKKNTPCIVTKASNYSLNVAFEPNENLLFASTSKNDSNFSLDFNFFSDSKYDIGIPIALRGEVLYQNKIYQVFIGKNIPYLLVNEESIKELEKKKRTVEGMKQPNS